MIFARDEQKLIVRANLDPAISLLQFPNEFSRANKNSINLFPELLGHQVEGVDIYSFERSFYIQFTNKDLLIFKMHGRRSNILFASRRKVHSVFRNRLVNDSVLVPDELHNELEISKNALARHDHDPLSMIPALGREMKIALERKGYYELPEDKKWQFFEGELRNMEQSPIFLVSAKLPRISLIEQTVTSTLDPITATNWLYEKLVTTIYFDKEKERIINQIKQKIKKSESYIHKSLEKLRKLESERSPEEVANLLMANLHNIQKGLRKVVLTDFYSDKPITIKLNPDLTPQKNAEGYYRKSKNRHQEIDTIKKNLKAKEKAIHAFSKQILEVQDIATGKELKKYRKENEVRKEKNKRSEPGPFHLFELDNWHIMVGKNSTSNDELTLKIAKKNDLWLHAKDVTGSHVVIKEKPGQNFPLHIIEYAASLAALNSKRKTDTLCPVIYTPKKYVRKIKGAPAGQVVVDKEEVLLVPPYRTEQ